MASADTLGVIKGKIDEILAKFPVVDEPLKKLSAKVKVEKAYLALVVMLIPLFSILLLGSGYFVVDLVAFVYPLYASIKAVETKDKEDDTQWLTYWIICSFFKIVESFADYLIAGSMIYFLTKVAFLVWCFYPTTQGAKTIYALVIKPYVVPALGINEPPSTKKSE